MIIATIFLLILTYGVYRYGLVRAKDRNGVLKLAPAFVVFGLLFLLTAIFALNDRLMTLGLLDLKDGPRNNKAMLVGTLGAEPPRIEIILDDSTRSLDEDDETFWIGQDDAEIGADVIVITAERDNGSVYPDIVFIGTGEDFRTYLNRAAIIPTLTMLLSLGLGIMTLLLPVIYYRRPGRASDA